MCFTIFRSDSLAALHQFLWPLLSNLGGEIRRMQRLDSPTSFAVDLVSLVTEQQHRSRAQDEACALESSQSRSLHPGRETMQKFGVRRYWSNMCQKTANTKQITICTQCLCVCDRLGSVLKQLCPDMANTTGSAGASGGAASGNLEIWEPGNLRIWNQTKYTTYQNQKLCRTKYRQILDL